jgi:hypothetical protein
MPQELAGQYEFGKVTISVISPKRAGRSQHEVAIIPGDGMTERCGECNAPYRHLLPSSIGLDSGFDSYFDPHERLGHMSEERIHELLEIMTQRTEATGLEVHYSPPVV